MTDLIDSNRLNILKSNSRLNQVFVIIALTLFVAIAVFLLTSSRAANYLDNFADIKAAIDRGDPEVLIANGTYLIPHGQGIEIKTNGQKILGQSDRGVKFIATGTRNQMGTRGVIDIRADNVELGNLVLTQSVDQLTHRATEDTGTYPVSGIDSHGDSWYIHDIHIDHTSYGMQMWKGTPENGTRRMERILVTNWGYWGPLFGHSGYGIYIQTHNEGVNTVVEMEDIVYQNGTDFGVHDYGTFSMPGPRRIRGMAAINSGSPTVTGSAGGTYPLYFAKAEDIEITNLHTAQYRDQIPVTNAFGYSTSFNAQRAVFNNVYALSDPAFSGNKGNQPTKKQGKSWPVWEPNNVFSYDKPDQRAAFDGLKPLGDSWAVLYGDGAIPNEWEVLPGSIEYPEKTSTNPAVPAITILRRDSGNPPPPPPPPPPEDTQSPSVSITAPSNNQQLTGTETIELSASDNIGVTSVDFYVDNNLVHTKNSQPYTFNWNTNSVSDDTHQLRAVAKDAAGNNGQSAVVTITVQNSDPDPDPNQNVSLSHFAYGPTGDYQTVKYTWSITGTYQPGNWLALFRVGDNVNNFVVDSNYNVPSNSGNRNQPIRVPEAGSYEVRMYDNANNLLATSGPLQLEYLGSEPVCEDPDANNFGGALPCTYDPDPDPTPSQPGDTDGDSDVDIADLSKLLSDWNPTGGASGSPADFNGDGKVDVVDLSVLLSNYGT